ncbi:MAG: thioredoxin domain-containing protein [Candidatus Micrarchaeia archaeon]
MQDKQFELGGQTLIALAIALLVGLGVGYYMYAALNPPAQSNANAMCNLGAVSGEYKPDMAKIDEISKLFQDIIYLQTGSEHNVNYVSYKVDGDLVALDFTVDGTFPQTLYATKDLKYLLQQPTDVSVLKAQVDSAKRQAEAELEAAKQPPQKSDKPVVKLFVMSFCPYGNVAENAFVDVVTLLENKIDFEPVYIISGSNGAYNSLHGQAELNQDIREKIIFEMYGAKKWMEFTYDVNQNCTLQNVDSCWKDVAARHNVDAKAVEEEYTKSFNRIADEEVAKTNQYAVTGSPTIIVNGKMYNGPRSSEAFKQFICSAFSTAPEECSKTLSTQQGVSTGSC